MSFFCQPVLIFNLFHEFLKPGLIFIFLNEIFCQPIVIFNLIYTVETAIQLHLNSVSDIIYSLCYICSLHAQYTFHSHHGMTHTNIVSYPVWRTWFWSLYLSISHSLSHSLFILILWSQRNTVAPSDCWTQSCFFVVRRVCFSSTWPNNKLCINLV
jgi:hypothetical protein